VNAKDVASNNPFHPLIKRGRRDITHIILAGFGTLSVK